MGLSSCERHQLVAFSTPISSPERNIILIMVAVAVMKHHNLNNWKEEKVYLAYIFHTIVRHWRKSGQELEEAELVQRPWRGDAYWIALYGYLGLLVGPRTTSPGMDPPSVNWALLHQWLMNRMPYRLAHNLIWWRHFLNWSSLLPDDYRLGQVDKKPSQHKYGTSSNDISFRICCMAFWGVGRKTWAVVSLLCRELITDHIINTTQLQPREPVSLLGLLTWA